MITSGHDSSGHLGNGDADGLALRGDADDFLVDFDSVLVSEHTGEHDFRAIADCVHRRILEEELLAA